MDYWDAIEYLLALPDLERCQGGAAGQIMTLDAMKRLLSRLGNPERGKRVVHVTGSKGKGSTSHMIASILQESGYKTALFTSPHLHDYVERIAIDLLPVSRFDFADAVNEIRDSIDEVNNGDSGPVSTFGALTALFFYIAAKTECDWCVVEVGMGGAQDATNVFLQTDVAVMTAVSLEHTNLLGNTCAAIAQEKSGIITPGCITVLADQKDSTVEPVVANACQKQGASFFSLQKTCRIVPVSHDSNGQTFMLETPRRKYRLHTGMLGLHQLQNAATAVVVAELLMEDTKNPATAINVNAIADGIANAELPGRLEQLTRHPITVVDGAHNGESMRALVDAIGRHFDFENIIFILGINGDKNLEEMLDAIKELSPKLLIATKSQNKRAMPPETIASESTRVGFTTRVAANVGDAVLLAKEFSASDDLVCVAGSLYIAGEARQIVLHLP